MANKKISDLTALGTTFGTADIFEVSRWTGSTFVSRKITGQEFSDSISSDNIGNSDLQVNSSLVIRALQLGGSTTSDGFAVRNFADTANFLTVLGDGQVWSDGGTGTDTNTVYGKDSGTSITSGVNLTIIGASSGGSLTNQSKCTVVGASALTSLNGADTTAIGYRSLESTSGSSGNTAVGSDSGRDITSGGKNNNVFVGRYAGRGVTGGSQSIYIGYNSASIGVTTGSKNTFIGSKISSSNVSNNVVIADGDGERALTKDANENVYFSDPSALATTATDGFMYVRGGAGVPTGTPSTSVTGHVPMYADTTNNKLYIYSGGAWVALN